MLWLCLIVVLALWVYSILDIAAFACDWWECWLRCLVCPLCVYCVVGGMVVVGMRLMLLL